MHYNLLSENELGFDAFIAPDDFNRTAQPVDIYTKFKDYYQTNNQARYIYYYSDGNFPLTLTPTATEYYRYGYTNALNQEVIVDVPLNGSPVTIWGNNITTPLNTSGGDESGYTKRWVVVCRPSTAKFDINISTIRKAVWIYCGITIDCVYSDYGSYYGDFHSLKYIHYANLNSMTKTVVYQFWYENNYLSGTCNIPETVAVLANESLSDSYNISKINLPNTKNVALIHNSNNGSISPSISEINFGASTSIPTPTEILEAYPYLSRLSVSQQNTLYTTFNGCDIVFSNNNTAIKVIAPKTVRGLYIPDELPQSEITALSTKLSAKIMQGFPLRIGSLITDLSNLYLSNKSFTTITVGAGNTAFTVENNILFNADKTTLVKAGTASTGSMIIPTTVTSVNTNAFLRYSHTGSIPLIFSGAGQFNLSNYNNFQFATFTGQSLSDIITNDKLVNGTIGSPKYFYINQASLDALNAYNSNAVTNAATQQYINISAFPIDYILSYDFNGNTIDRSSNSLNATLVGGATITNNRLNVTANNQYLQTNDSDLLSFGSGAFSFSFKLFLNSIGTNSTNSVIMKRDSSSIINNAPAEYHIRVSNAGLLSIILIDSSKSTNAYLSANIDAALQINTEYKCQITFSGGTGNNFKFYINGVLVSHSYTMVGTYTQMRNTSARLITGNYGENYTLPLFGYIDNLYIYNRELNQNEITLLASE